MALAGPAPFDLVRMARQLARALATADPLRGGSYVHPPASAGPHIAGAERGYFLALVANHLNRHTQECGNDGCGAGAGPCRARGAAYALYEVIQFEADEHSEEQEPARALRDTLASLRAALDRASQDLQDYLEACAARHADESGWGRERSHRHEITCTRPELLRRRVDRWLATIAAVEADSVEPQFGSMTSKSRLLDNRRQKLRNTVESLLREEGWLLREILEITEERPAHEDEYKARLESIKKRVAGIHRRRAPRADHPPAPISTVSAWMASSRTDNATNDNGEETKESPQGNPGQAPRTPPAA